MNDIKNLLLERIYNINQLNHLFNTNKIQNTLKAQTIFLHNYFQKDINIRSQPKKIINVLKKPNQLEIKKYQLKDLNAFKKLQKIREIKQMQVLNSMNGITFISQKQVQQFYYFSICIFQNFDHQFSKYRHKVSMMSVSMQENLKKLYSFFFLKHDKQQEYMNVIPEALKRQIWNLSPSFFLGWIRKWSRNLFYQKINNIQSEKNEQNIRRIIPRNQTYGQNHHYSKQTQFNFIKKNKSYKQQIRKSQKVKQINQQQESINKISITLPKLITNILSTHSIHQFPSLNSLNNKETVYSYCLDEMKQYYKFIPIQDLDYGYLRNLKKLGRKQQILIGQNIKKTVDVLIESKNFDIKQSIQKYKQQYYKCYLMTHLQFNKFLNPQQVLQLNLQKNKVTKHLSPNKYQKLFNLNSKLLTPQLNQPKSFISKIKFHNQCQKINNLNFSEMNEVTVSFYNQKHIINEDIRCDNTKKISFLYSENNVFKNMISSQTVQLQKKIKILSKINKRNQDLSRLKSNNSNNSLQKQQNYKKKQEINYFLDRHIDQKQKLSRFPKITIKQIQRQENQKDHRSISLFKNKNKNNRQKKKTIIVFENRQNKTELQNIKRKLINDEEKRSLQLQTLLARNSINLPRDNQDQQQDPNHRRFFSQAAEKVGFFDHQRQSEHIGRNERRLIGFNKKQKWVSGNKKGSLNVIKYVKRKGLMKSELWDCGKVSCVNKEMRNKLVLRNNIDKGIELGRNPSVFKAERFEVEGQNNHDEFINYLKKIEKERKEGEECKQKGSSIWISRQERVKKFQDEECDMEQNYQKQSVYYKSLQKM